MFSHFETLTLKLLKQGFIFQRSAPEANVKQPLQCQQHADCLASAVHSTSGGYLQHWYQCLHFCLQDFTQWHWNQGFCHWNFLWFWSLILAKRVFDTLVQTNTKKQISTHTLLHFFFPYQFLYCWIFCFLFFLHTGTTIINYVFVMHANSGNFAPADCMHFTFLLCTVQKESGSNYYTGVLYCTGVKECCFVFYELLWICMAGTRTRTVLCPQYV